jgi:hypothetical protein
MPICPNHTCVAEPAKVAEAKAWKCETCLIIFYFTLIFYNYNLFLANADGKFRYACGKQYFLSNTPKNQQDAKVECCKYGMKLLSLETVEEMTCLANMNIGMAILVIKRKPKSAGKAGSFTLQ